MDQTPWIDITTDQPAHKSRALMRFANGTVRIGDYNRFDWRLWGVTQWKSVPNEQRQQADL